MNRILTNEQINYRILKSIFILKKLSDKKLEFEGALRISNKPDNITINFIPSIEVKFGDIEFSNIIIEEDRLTIKF